MSESLRWLIQTLADVPESDDWLSVREFVRLEGMRFPKRRSDWRLGRWTAKQAVCAYRFAESPALASLEIRASGDGAPEVFWNDHPLDVSISISHSRDRGFCVVGPGGFMAGCDLEWVEPREDRFEEDYFTAGEMSFVRKVPDAERPLFLNLIWSAKETMLKALREGLRRDTRSVSVRVDSGICEEGWNAWTGLCLETSRTFHGWWREAEGYVYTLAADQPTAVPRKVEGMPFRAI